MVRKTNHSSARRPGIKGAYAPLAMTPKPSARRAPKVLLVVAHPDDEYAVAATVYRLTREAGAVVDQLVITDGAGGYRYSALAETIYGLPLTNEATGRACLPAIRQRETRAAGRILGIRRHYFLGEPDGGFTLDLKEAEAAWNMAETRRFLTTVLESERYEYIFTLLPSGDTHGHHQAAAMLALEAAHRLPEDHRPVVLGAEPGVLGRAHRAYRALPGRPATQAAARTWEVPRTGRFGFRDALDYRIVVNWVIAEHKSQGFFQTEVGSHDVERFWVFASAGSRQYAAADALFTQVLGTGAAAREQLYAKGA